MFWGIFENTNMSHCAKIVFLQNLGDVKNEVFKKKLHLLFSFFFYVGEVGTEKRKNGKRRKNS